MLSLKDLVNQLYYNTKATEVERLNTIQKIKQKITNTETYEEATQNHELLDDYCSSRKARDIAGTLGRTFAPPTAISGGIAAITYNMNTPSLDQYVSTATVFTASTIISTMWSKPYYKHTQPIRKALTQLCEFAEQKKIRLENTQNINKLAAIPEEFEPNHEEKLNAGLRKRHFTR